MTQTPIPGSNPLRPVEGASAQPSAKGKTADAKSTDNAAFRVLATGVSNDSDGDGVPEPMFRLDDPVYPTRLTIQITTRSRAPHHRNKEISHYTLVTDVVFRRMP